MKKHHIIYCYTAKSPFVDKDVAILTERFEVRQFHFDSTNKRKLLLVFVHQLGFLTRYIFGTKLLVNQFAGLHSFLPVLFSRLFFKKSIMVAGGTDCVAFPSIRYGNFANPKIRFFTKFSFKNASLILPVHDTLVYCDYTYQNQDYPHQGIKFFIPELKTKTVVIHNGYDSNYWKRGEVAKNKNSFLTAVAYVNSRFTMTLKGLDLYIELARKFPECTFTLLGGSSLDFIDKPANLKIVANIWGEKLVALFSSHQFYVQLSVSEGFPNALSEAMLCECLPLVSAVGGMPDIVGETGFVLKKRDANELFKLAELAMSSTQLNELGKSARERIATNYTFENRRVNFLRVVDELLD